MLQRLLGSKAGSDYFEMSSVTEYELHDDVGISIAIGL